MAIDPNSVGASGEPQERSWTEKDSMLYALGVGCGTEELSFSTEKNQQVLPTQAVILGGGGIPFDKLGEFNFALMVHGSESIELYKPLPPAGTIRSTGRIKAIWDKGSAAVVEMESEAVDPANGDPVFKVGMSLFIRGEGGWGGDRGPSGSTPVPERAPDHQVSYTTSKDQALLYRHSGDMNPLHSDPEFAAIGGFDRPILHGLCTYGFTGRALLHTLCDSDPARFKGMEGRFTKPVYPGDDLTISMWVDGNEAVYQTTTQRDEVAISGGRFRFE